MTSRIIILRHGITEGNKNRWFYGSTDLPLLEEGREELRRKRERGFYPGIPEDAGFFTTGLVRTDETLELVYGKHEPTYIPELQEMKFGEYECHNFDELKDDPVFTLWGYDEAGDVELPGGESRNQFVRRIMAGYHRLMALHNDRAEAAALKGREAVDVVVCHGGVIGSLMQEIFPGERSTMWDWIPEPGCGYIWTVEDGRPVKYALIGEIMESYIEETE